MAGVAGARLPVGPFGRQRSLGAGNPAAPCEEFRGAAGRREGGRDSRQARRLFAYEDINGEPLEGRHAVITPYLVDGSALVNPHLVVREEGSPVNGKGHENGSERGPGGASAFAPRAARKVP